MSLLFLIQDDRTGNLDKGPKPWGTGHDEGSSGGGWTSWLLAVGLAFVASIIYRMYFTKE